MKYIKTFEQFLNEGIFSKKDYTENKKLARKYPTIEDLPYTHGDKVQILDNGKPTSEHATVSGIATVDNPKYPETLLHYEDGSTGRGLYGIDFK